MLRKLPLVDEIALRAIRCTVRQSIQRGWFRRDEFKDLIHDVVVQLLQKLDGFDPSRSSWPTFCTLIARNYLASKARQFHRRMQVDSLQDPVDGCADTRLEETIEARHATGHCSFETRSDQEWAELHEDLLVLLDRLPDPLRDFCESYLENSTFEATANALGVNRKTVYRRRQVIREFVAEECLHEYRF